MKKYFLASLISLFSLSAFGADFPTNVLNSYASTQENDSVCGDCIYIRFSKKVTSENWTDPRIVSSVSIPAAPAGELNGSTTSSRNAAKNYSIKIIPEPGSTTTPYSGTWFDLGGKVIYDSYDPGLRTVILIPGSNVSVFKPGDKIEVTFSSNLVDISGKNLNLKGKKISYYAS